MKKKIYIILGYEESPDLSRYQALKLACSQKGYEVCFPTVDWHKPLSPQVFFIEKGATVLGFSLGAVLAYLIAKKNPCKKAIFASMTPIHRYSRTLWLKEVYLKDMSKVLAEACAKDIKSFKVDLHKLKTPHVVLAGELEQKKTMPADFLVPKNNHRMNSKYINAIAQLL